MYLAQESPRMRLHLLFHAQHAPCCPHEANVCGVPSVVAAPKATASAPKAEKPKPKFGGGGGGGGGLFAELNKVSPSLADKNPLVFLILA